MADVGIVKIRGKARNEDGKPKTAEILKKPDGWYLSVSFEYEHIQRESGHKAIGLDWGVEHYFSTIDHEGNFAQIKNPRFLSANRNRLAALQRDLALVKKGSRSARKLKQQISKLHQKIARQRLDYTHKVTSQIVSEAALIATEELNVKNMTRSAKGTQEKPGKRVKQKAGLNREILNTAPAMTLQFLTYKAEEAGSDLALVPTRKVKPSQTCPDCGAQRKKALSERWHRCQCGCDKPRDVASAQVNLNWALGIQAGNPPQAPA